MTGVNDHTWDTSLPLVARTASGSLWVATGELDPAGSEVIYRLGDPEPFDLRWFLDEYSGVHWYRLVLTVTGWER